MSQDQQVVIGPDRPDEDGRVSGDVHRGRVVVALIAAVAVVVIVTMAAQLEPEPESEEPVAEPTLPAGIDVPTTTVPIREEATPLDGGWQHVVLPSRARLAAATHVGQDRFVAVGSGVGGAVIWLLQPTEVYNRVATLPGVRLVDVAGSEPGGEVVAVGVDSNGAGLAVRSLDGGRSWEPDRITVEGASLSAVAYRCPRCDPSFFPYAGTVIVGGSHEGRAAAWALADGALRPIPFAEEPPLDSSISALSFDGGIAVGRVGAGPGVWGLDQGLWHLLAVDFPGMFDEGLGDVAHGETGVVAVGGSGSTLWGSRNLRDWHTLGATGAIVDLAGVPQGLVLVRLDSSIRPRLWMQDAEGWFRREVRWMEDEGVVGMLREIAGSETRTVGVGWSEEGSSMVWWREEG